MNVAPIYSMLLHSGLNWDWDFWLPTRFSCCLKMKSVENILGYIQEQFYRFSRGCKPRENLWNCSRKYPKMFENYFIFRQAWSCCYYATGCFVKFLGDFFEPTSNLGPLPVWTHFRFGPLLIWTHFCFGPTSGSGPLPVWV